MCGLLGALLDEPRLTDEQVAGALGCIAHRGPDHTAWRFSADRTRTRLPTYILTFLGDRMEMAHSVEGRVPFLDHHVAEYAARLPVHYKIRGLREKHVLREAVRDVVLPEIYDRHKHPFMTPPARDGIDPLAVFCQDTLRSGLVGHQPFFDPARVRRLMDDVNAMAPDDRAAFEGVVLLVVSACLLTQRFGLSG
jgi:asparagine synthase (glutamine-hydrolysing)